jgi:hypothetical protein
MTLSGHGFVITVHIWMFLSKCQKAGLNPVVECEYLLRFQYCDENKIICSIIYNAIIQPGAPLHETTWQSCHCSCRVSMHSHRVKSKCCNCLKGDIVEALQCIKCAI